MKAIKEWYLNTDEPFTFFCEDDLSFDTVKYWNFTWQDFFDNLPEDWDCVQLCLVREDMFYYYFADTQFKLRNRCFDDWSGCAYLISRRHAKNLVENYHSDKSIHLEYKGTDRDYRVNLSDAYWFLLPQIENLIYSCFDTGKIYSFPLFAENISFKSTWSSPDENNINHKSHYEIIGWWKNIGSKFFIESLMEHKC